MSLLQSIVGQLLGGQSTNQQHGLMETVASLLNSPQIGGINGLAKMFQNNGLGHLTDAWIGNGPNPPVTPDQLQQVLGDDQMAGVAQQLGVDQDQAASQLAVFLPHAIDHLTPNGAVPQTGEMDMTAMFNALKSRFLA